MTSLAFRYLIFCGQQSNPMGGAGDYLGGEFHLENALAVAESIIGKVLEIEVYDDAMLNVLKTGTLKIQWAHVFDVEANMIVAKYGALPANSNIKIIFD
ncbi:hypothetical protein VIBNIFTn2_120111 [Vibrio nigripulchritudo FTn2]|uniref:hypothetical protein n=1 Tax=Vibrio nigripulchritudo TaxID=28173 RepID=UPI0003B1E480|nr:hypothetical protein [Vibrio nigripulchritudo]CCN40129.1 hypothetical protein VIBNIFTn2_120111 [Vibrio nigripulchritudo FTn2]